MLTQSAYADDKHLRSRLAIFAYAETPADPRWRTSFVPWDGTQIVADVGCGSGLDLRQLVPEGRCRHAFGVDLSGGMLRSLADLRRSGLTPVQADAQRLPLGEGSVDVCLAMHMLYHVPDVRAAVRELRRIVRPGGTVLASTNSNSTLGEVMLAFPSAQPVVDYFNSIREPIERLVGEPFGVDAVLGGIATRIEQVIRAQGCFRTASRSGVFVCR